ncbi:MAG: PspA/IM30 family protein [Thermosynechococcaceae cyanobacterium MS004]|nr:PspA/IM30 family protein [Thermosynechococcaceae cyanobacterium MS004]
MKQVMYWLMGDRTARIIIATWHWLWGIPLEGNQQIAKEVAQESLLSMQNSVAKLRDSVATVSASHQQAKAIYQQKEKEFKQAESQALLAHEKGESETAHLAMVRAIQIEELLPKLQERVAQARQLEEQMQRKLKLEQQKLEHFKGELQNIDALVRVNKALEAIVKTSGALDIGTAKNQFEQAREVIHNQYIHGVAAHELSQNPADVLQENLEQLTLEDKVQRRFKQLDRSLVDAPAHLSQN